MSPCHGSRGRCRGRQPVGWSQEAPAGVCYPRPTVPIFRCLSNINQLFPQHLQEVTFPIPSSRIRRNARPNPLSKAGARLQERACPGHPLLRSRYFRSEAACPPRSSCRAPGVGSLCPAYPLEPPGAGGTQHSLEVTESATRTARSPDPPPAEGRVCPVRLSGVSPHTSERPVST